MATTFSPNYLKSYTNDTWTNLVVAPVSTSFVVRHYMACNTTATAILVSFRIVDSSDTELAIIANNYLLDADKPLSCVQTFILLQDGEKLQAKAAAAGVHFSAWGGYE